MAVRTNTPSRPPTTPKDDGSTSTHARRAVRALGLFVSLVALAWIGSRFIRSGGITVLRELPIGSWQLAKALLAGSVTYALISTLLALAWWRLLAALSPVAPPSLAVMSSYAVSQYGRYLPGNVAHYALRHAWNRRFGVPHESLGLAAVLEAVLLLLIASALTLFTDARGNGLVSYIDPRVAIALPLAGLAALWLALRWAQRRGGIGRLHIPVLSAPALITGLLCYCGFLVLCAALLAGLAHCIGIDSGSFPRLLATSSGSWLAGFIVVGAPAGLGVREATFVALSQADMDERHALLLIGLYRIVTFLGDTLFMAAGMFYQRAQRRSA